MPDFNETKYPILKTLHYAPSNNIKHMTPDEIAKHVGISHHAATQQLSKLSLWGYIWRKLEYRENKRNKYCYKFLKEKGERIFFDLDFRVRVREATGIFVSLNLNKPIPAEALQLYQALKIID